MFYFQLALGWTFYFALHSLLAADSVKEKCRVRFPELFSYYRILYNLVATGGILLLAAWSFRDTTFLFQPGARLKFAGSAFIVSGLLMLGVAFASFNLKEFLGLEREAHDPDAKLVTKGIYQYVRHPLYTGIFLLLPGLLLCRPTISILLFILITIVYIEIGSRLEEKKLIRQFGEEYIQYSQAVKRYFPFIY